MNGVNGDIASEIIPRLYIGNMNTARNKMFFTQKGIGAVLNLTPDVPHYFASPNSNIEYMRISVDDSLKKEDFEKMYKCFPCIVNFIMKNHYIDGKSVLVHCHAGMQRSAAAVAAFLIKVHKSPLPNVIDFMIKKRPIVFGGGRSINFKQSLDWYQRDCQGQQQPATMASLH